MSDDDFMYEDEEEYEFEYEEDDGEGGEEVGVENRYYNAKGLREDFDAAIREFQTVVDDSPSLTEWGFKATKQMLKLCLREGQFDQVLSYYEKMLDYVRQSIVARNYAEKSINNMLERVSVAATPEFVQRFHQITLAVLKETKNDRLWLRTSLRLAKILLDQQEYPALDTLLGELRRECEDDSGAVILERGTQLLEIHAMYLAMYAAREEHKRLKDTYLQCMTIKSAIPHPRIMGFIRECGGKMYMGECNWEQAKANFFDAFKNYDEAGSPQRVQVLKYLVLASLLSESEVNPLSGPEAMSYVNDPAIVAITALVAAFESQDVVRFEHTLSQNTEHIQDDPFIARYIADLRRTLRMQALESAVLPYTRIRIDSLAKRLDIAPADAEQLLVALILDKRLKANIDQEQGILAVEQDTAEHQQFEALNKWATNMESLLRSAIATIG
ncbi:hypothetical protein H4R27_001988 [Coemansia aciculifera]|uniref:PCI domain-containing protein n=1 Tax=Coemansia pectinata TaxID=1052879 RepID=A0A9W8GV13_9FUNG|nr:hypothetical protein GGI19_003765 [Coemansia pectinata]KAJ2884601.1 hypothetical protein H4R27_001988 [Coemansia aciculifera]